MANVTSTIFPPDTDCWVNETSLFSSVAEANVSCASQGLANVTQRMIDYLNLTSFDNYLQAYCLNPDPNDSCPFNYCPNSDVAGILTRVSIYVSSVCLAIMIYYSHDSSARKDAYWAQNFSVYSVLISAAVSYVQKSMTEFHSIIATELAGSPLTFYMAFYAIRSIFGNSHKMDDLMGKKHVWHRVIAVGTFCLWAIYLGFSIGRSHEHFSQGSCQDRDISELSFILPFILFSAIWTDISHVAVLILGLPLLLVVVAWGVAIFLRRETLWYRDHSGKLRHPGFWKVWALIGEEYPFTHFMSVCFFPFLFWISTIEISLVGSNDNQFEASFGQVLAICVTFPSLKSVLGLTPKLATWFTDLAWWRWLTGRPQKKSIPSGADLPLATIDVRPPGLGRMASDGSLETTKLKGGSEVAIDSK